MHICFKGVDRDAGEMAVFELLPAQSVPNGIHLAEGGSVLDMAKYELHLWLDSGRIPSHALVSINGGAPESLVHSKTIVIEGENHRAAYCMSRVDPWHPEKRERAVRYFKMTYGFARVDLELFYEGEDEPLLLSTLDIPCRSQNPVDSANVNKMLGQLLDSDDAASNWMFAGTQGAVGSYSIMDGCIAEHTAKSPAAMVDLLDRVLDEYEYQVGFFLSGAYSRIVRQGRTVPLGSVRRAGRDELIWLARNTGVLSECAERQGFFYSGSWYLPRKMETSVRVKTFDGYENRKVLGFLAQIVNVASLLRVTLGRASSDVRSIEQKLNSIANESAFLPALTIIRAYAERERRFLERLEGCISRGRELKRIYASCMPDVQEEFGRIVRRTKVFTEVRPYARLYSLMQEWLSFGDFSLAKEGLALQAAKMDKLYEYYALYNILRWLSEHGFAPREGRPDSVRCGSYAPEGFFKPEIGVSTVYELEQPTPDGPISLTLYYQPIIRSSVLEEEGVALHRLSYSKGSRSQNYWTPDFLIALVGVDGARSYHVLDAKYRMVHEVFDGYPKFGTLAECVLKYRVDVSGASGEQIDSVWLLAGKWKYEVVQYAEASPWAKASAIAPRSGVAALTTEDNCLDDVFAEVFHGIARAVDVTDGGTAETGEGIAALIAADALGGGSAERIREKSPKDDYLGDEGDICLIAEIDEDIDEAVDTGEEDGGGLEGSAPTNGAAEADEVLEIGVEAVRAAEGTPLVGHPQDDERAVRDELLPTVRCNTLGVSEGTLKSDDRPAANRRKKKRAAEKPKQEEKTPKPVKKASLPKPKNEKRHKNTHLFELDDATRRRVVFVADNIEDGELLFNVKWSQINLGLERPLLRARKPDGREASFYEQVHLAGKNCWLNTRWTPVQKNKVKMLAKMLEAMDVEDA